MNERRASEGFHFSAERAITSFAGAVILAICFWVAARVADLGDRVTRIEEGNIFIKYRLDQAERGSQQPR